MTLIDLVDYTKTDAKIPTTFLEPKHVEVKIKTWEILMAYGLDYLAIVSSTAAVAMMMEVAFENYMMTTKLLSVYGKIGFTGFALNCLPVIFMGYYFFSFFFNHGQSWGMSVMKTRLEMTEHNYKSSLYWGMISSIVLMTGGIAMILGRRWLDKKSWGDFKAHDYLYMTLMQDRDISPINLVDYSSCLKLNGKELELEAGDLKAA